MKHLRHLFTALLLLFSVAVNAHDFEVGGIYYNILSSTKKTVAVTYEGSYCTEYCDRYTGNVVIPENVTYSGVTYSVTYIGDNAFYGCTDLTSVVIPNSVIVIEFDAFSHCKSFEHVTIGNGVKVIEYDAFENCEALVDVVIPNSVLEIDDKAFYGCSSLEHVTIGNGVKVIEYGAFENCEALVDVVIPNSVLEIDDKAFYGCSSLERITVGSGVTSIGDDAFDGCYRLETIYNYSSLEFTIGSSDYGGIAKFAKEIIDSNKPQVSLEKSAVTIIEGGYYQFNVTIYPAGATVEWSTDNPSVATVDDSGMVTAGACGTATITATAGSESASCVVTVKKMSLSAGRKYRLKNVRTGYYMTIVSTEGYDINAGGVQIKSLEYGNSNQIFQLEDIEGANLKIKSVDGYYLASFAAWGYKATEDENASTTHLLAETEEGVYTLRGDVGCIGSNNDAEGGNVDGAWVYSNHTEEKENIYWAFEPVVELTELEEGRNYRLKNVSTGFYMTVESTEGTNMDAGGVKIKSFEFGAQNQIFQLEYIDDNNLKIKSVDGYYLASFDYWGYKATKDENASTTHLLAVTEEGDYTLEGSAGYIGSNNNDRDGNVDGAWVYSDKGSDAQNIYWVFERLSFDENKLFAGVPFDYYDSYDNIEYWSYLKFNATDQNYLYYNSETPSDVLKTDRNAVDETNEDAYMWAFVGDNISGFKVYNKAAGPSLCLNATSDGAALGTADHLFKVSDSEYAANGFYMQSTNSEYRDRFNKQNGQVVYWGYADSGSTFMLVEGTPYGELSLLISTAETKCNELKNKVGTKVGVYSQETIDAFESRINEAKALERDEVTKDFVADFQKFVDTPVTAILPEKDKCYVLKSGLSFAETKAVYNDNGVAKWKTFDENDFSFYWKLVEVNGGYALQNLADDKYLRGNSGQSGQWSVTEDIESTNLLNIEVMPHPEDETETTPDEYAIILAGWQMHTEGHGGGASSAGNVVSWNTDAMKSASAWFIEDAPATCLVEYIYKLDGEVVATHEKRVMEGSEYPAHAYQAPYGVVIDGVLPEGNVAEDKTVEFVLTVEKELPFVAAAGGEPAKWYYLKMHDNPEVSSYIQDAGAEDASIEWVDKSFAAGEQDSHLWGFVGNLWDGFVVVNKATGKAIKSTGSGAATMVDVAEATKFIAWDSKVDEEGWFRLKTPAGNFLNGQDDKVQHYEDNDNGSSFYAYDASLDFNTPELTLSESVTSLYRVTIEFARENVVNWPDETVIQVCADGEVVESIAKGDAEFFMSGFSFTFGFEITKDTEVTLEFPDGFSITSIAGEEFTAYDNLKFEVLTAFGCVVATPNVPVNKLETITLEFNKKIVLCDNVQAVNIIRGSDVAGTVPVENMRVEDGTYLILNLDEPIFPVVEENDILQLTLPAGTVKDANYGEPNEELHLEFNLVQPDVITIETLNYNNDGYDITIEFNTDIVVEWGDIETIPVVDVNGAEVTCIRTERATVKNNILTLYLENAIAAEGEYTFYFPEGVVKKNDKVFYGGSFTFENRSKLLYNSHMPAEEVDALKTITVEFTEGIESVGDMTLEVKKDGEVVAEIIPDNTEIKGAEVVFTLDKEITEGGTYTVELPEGLVKGISGSSLFDSKVIEFKVSYKCFDVNVTPSPSDVVNELDVIEIEFNDDISDIAPDAVFDIVDAENNFVTTATASVVGKVVTFVLANPLVNIGTYTLVVADNVITSVHGACYGGKVFTFDVAQYYSVTYVVDEAVVDKREFLHYEKVTCPQDPEKEGYTFMGWENLPDEMPAEDVVVTAIFEVNSYNVTFMLDGEEYMVVEVEYGARVPSPAAPAKEGHKFAGWDGVPSSMPAEDIYVEAKFTVNSYTVTFKVDGKTYKKVTVEYGTEIELPEEPEKVGRTFIGWDGLPESMPAENITLDAMFEVNSYTVTFMWGDEVYAEVSVEYGAKIELPANPEVEGHTFISWKDVPRTMPAEDVVVTANFKVNSYIVTFMIDGKVYKTMSVQYGAVIEVPEPTKNGYTFDGWSYVPATMPAENITVTGSFTQIETAIDQVLIDSGEVVIYDLNGLRIVDVHELKRGVYIVNGKKTLVK